MNWLEQLAAEWSNFAPGGYAYEVDVLAYDPRTRELHHVEVSGSAASWAHLKRQTVRKFLASKEEFSNDEARMTNKARMTNHKRDARTQGRFQRVVSGACHRSGR